MNLLLGIISLLSCTAIGYFLSEKYIDRKNFYNDFYSFNERLLYEVSFGQKTVLTLIVEEKNKNRAFGKSLYSLVTQSKQNNVKFLSEDEKSFFTDYSLGLGKSDIKTQINYLNGYKYTLADKKKCAESETGKYKNLYVKIGFLLGIIILIALI